MTFLNVVILSQQLHCDIWMCQKSSFGTLSLSPLNKLILIFTWSICQLLQMLCSSLCEDNSSGDVASCEPMCYFSIHCLFIVNCHVITYHLSIIYLRSCCSLSDTITTLTDAEPFWNLLFSIFNLSETPRPSVID